MCGDPYPPSVVHHGQQLFLFAAFTVSILFLLHFGGCDHREATQPVKVALLVTASRLWYCNNLVANILVGHCCSKSSTTQYLSLVWIYNRNRVRRIATSADSCVCLWRSGSLIGLYVGLVFAYARSLFQSHSG